MRISIVSYLKDFLLMVICFAISYVGANYVGDLLQRPMNELESSIKLFEDITKRNSELSESIISLQENVDKSKRDSDSEYRDLVNSLTALKDADEFNKIRKTVKELESNVSGLKDMVVQLSPEQVISIARLTDLTLQQQREVADLKNEVALLKRELQYSVDSIKTAQDVRIVNFKEIVQGSMSMHNTLTFGVFLALVALLLPGAADVFNNFRESKITKKIDSDKS